MSRSITRCMLGLVLSASALGLALGLAGCKPHQDSASGDPSGSAASSFPRNETFYVGGLQWGEPSSFNPLLSSPAWPLPSGEGTYNLLYETLLTYNPSAGEMRPLLAESHTVTEDAIEVVLNPAARWNDGKPVTGWDVKYTFDLGKTYKGLRIAPRWSYLSEIVLVDEVAGSETGNNGVYPRRIRFVLNKDRRNPLVVLDTLQETAILPKHIIEPLLASVHGDMDEFTKLKFDHDTVTSGPYRLHAYSSEKIVVARDDAYWGNAALHGGRLPGPKYIIEPIYKSNDNFSIALQQGRLDASICFVPRIWLKQSKGVQSWYEKEPFFVSATIPMLIPNVTRPPMDDLAMRRAMAFAINYRDIRELAVSGYSEPIKPGLILPFGLEGKYYSEEDAAKYGASYDPAKAKALLKEAGYTSIYDADGELVETRDKSGNTVPTVYIKSPTGWSDWESIVRIVVNSLRAVGIDARERFIDSNLYWPAMFAGDFDLVLHQPAPAPTPSQPWARFEEVLSSRDWAPVGDKMYKNIGRFNRHGVPSYDAHIDELLEKIPTLRDEKELVTAYRELNAIYMQAQVTLPLVYRPDTFYEVSVRHWNNFPSAKNPYGPPQIPGDRLGTDALWSIHAVGAP